MSNLKTVRTEHLPDGRTMFYKIGTKKGRHGQEIWFCRIETVDSRTPEILGNRNHTELVGFKRESDAEKFAQLHQPNFPKVIS